ncbi:spermidine/putrescine ABC transporter substrate-binding protein [Anabaena sp. FACHB-1237]|uniref:ABC transporter substrate-binding protein n=1 Tax=Anabaena sp. FACHB-1237 TaxID=2692769 RepID=UPI0016816018|nr:spermidine/putrescine ABC transporter substrate-binding protein [Anabaena sp. FACHB-1237]MBD2137883.1 spermidine/putrescine ABC transporter substrate-binding protein [Anabaena sp. FACHB-1237]
MTSRRKLLQQLAIFSTLSLSSCGWRLANVSSNSISSHPRDQLYVYSWTQYTDQQLLTTFTTQTGMKVIADVYDSSDVMLAKLQAGGGASYSVIYPSDYMVQKMVAKKLLSPINHSRLLGLDNLFPQFHNPTYDPNNIYSIPFNWGTTGLLYNSEKLAKPPQDWEYLWQNKDILNKRMTLLNDVREVMGATLRMLGYSYNSQNEKEIKQAYQKLQSLKPAIAAFDTDAWQNKILAGDLLIAMCYSADAMKISQENPKFKYVIPRSGSSLWTDTIVIPISAPNSVGAYAWINLLLQPEIAAEIVERLHISTPNRAAFDLLPKKLQEDTNLFPPDSIINKCERLTPVDEFEQVYDRYWTQLLS